MFASLIMKILPVQHIIGRNLSFIKIAFLTPPGTFIPRPDTELLVDCAKYDFNDSRPKQLTSEFWIYALVADVLGSKHCKVVSTK